MMQNNCRTRTPVDSFVQLNLKPSIDITVEDYKKVSNIFYSLFSILIVIHTTQFFVNNLSQIHRLELTLLF